MKSTRLLFVSSLVLAQLVHFACAGRSLYLKGLTPQGEKVYIGPVPIQDTEAYQTFIYSSQSEAAKLDYLLRRIKAAQDLVYYHNGGQHNWLEAYRAGSWVLRHHYKKSENARSFIRKEVLLYQEPGNPTAIKFPNGSIHLVYYILMNELDLLEGTVKQNLNA